MRVHSLLAAGLVAGAWILLAPSARADTFFVTVTNGATTLGARTQGATFEASTTSTPSGPKVNPVAIEIDDWSLFEPTLDVMGKLQPVTVKVEFTTPNAQGQEEVYMIATYQRALFSRISATYESAGSPRIKQSLFFGYESVQYRPPPLKLSTEGARRSLPSSAPTVRRVVRPVVLAQRIDDAYFQSTSFVGESADHPGQTRLLSFAFDCKVPIDMASGLPAGRLMLVPVTFTKAAGAATPAFKAAMASRKIIDPATISFVQHQRGAPDITSFSVLLTSAVVTAESLQVATTSVETLGITPAKLRLTAGAATTELSSN